MDNPIDSRKPSTKAGLPSFKAGAAADKAKEAPSRRLGMGHYNLHSMSLDASNTPLAKLLGYPDKLQCLEGFDPGAHNIRWLFDALIHAFTGSVENNFEPATSKRFSQELLLKRVDGGTVTVRASFSYDADNHGMDFVFEDVEHLKVIEGVVAEAFADLRRLSGEEFLWGAVRTLSDLFDGAFVGLAVPADTPDTLVVEAAWEKGRPADSFCYDIAGTPCREVFGKQPRSYCAHVAELFPNDVELQRMGAEAYIGVPLFDEDREAGGILCLISKDPVSDDRSIKTALLAYAERVSLELARQRSEHKLHSVWRNTVAAISATIEKRDPYTSGHQARTAELVTRIARALNWPEAAIEGLEMAALMHDIGKINIPSEILMKPGALREEEFALIKSHPQAGYDILKSVDFPWPVATMVLQHHERLDGSGYPRGLKAEDILPGARLLAIADVAESMSSHRPYRPALGMDAARAEIQRGMGTIYDEAMCKAFLALEVSPSS
ncbi:HD-GYP domain-containing protein [Congregibacter sp.]|uniref:HD-GYP domain-containing protein n=1 Tax=Congregibacter sp. TaxID=2744308 RepID=UPI003F6D1F1F